MLTHPPQKHHHLLHINKPLDQAPNPLLKTKINKDKFSYTLGGLLLMLISVGEGQKERNRIITKNSVFAMINKYITSWTLYAFALLT